MLILRAFSYLIGAGLLVFALAYNSYSSQFGGWASAPGQLHSVSGFRVSRDLATKEHESNYGRVSFSYVVAGKRYVGYRVLPLQSIYLPPEKVAVLEPGDIRISYNPEAPEESFIHAEKPVEQLKILVLVGLILLFIGYFVPPVLSRVVEYVLDPPKRVGTDYLD